MMKKALLSIGFAVLLVLPCSAAKNQKLTPVATHGAGADVNTAYALTAWSELGMHCMDGKDFSVFSVLPPYNTIHAQLFKKGEPPVAITSGVNVTYQAVTDTHSSINTVSGPKTNFWTWISTLFLVSQPKETGLAGYKTQSKTPQAMT